MQRIFGYLKLRFAQATDRLTLESYKAFKKTCSKKEWTDYEPQLLKELDKAWETDRIKIHMFRKEYDKALSLLKKLRYPDMSYGGDEILKIVEKLEKKYPEEILAFYRSGLGNLDRSFDRKTYAHKARVMAKVRHMWVDVMKTPEKWESFGRKVKEINRKRPAFQQEFAGIIPEWRTL